MVIPPTAQVAMLVELHAGHPGISRMKALVLFGGQVWIPILKNKSNSVQAVS